MKTENTFGPNAKKSNICYSCSTCDTKHSYVFKVKENDFYLSCNNFFFDVIKVF